MAEAYDPNNNDGAPVPRGPARAQFVLRYTGDYRAELTGLLMRGARVVDAHEALGQVRRLLCPASDAWLYLPTLKREWQRVMGAPFPPPQWGDEDTFFHTHEQLRLIRVFRLPDGDVVFQTTERFRNRLLTHLRELEALMPLLALERLSLEPCPE